MSMSTRMAEQGLIQDRQLFGLRVRSALQLDEFREWTGDDRSPDITITIGRFPLDVEDALHRGPFLAIGRSGVCHLNIPAVARFRIERGCLIVIDPQIPTDAQDIKTFLLGSVLGILCHQRGLLPLHASAVQIEDRAVAFAGNSGAGKSSLAAMLASRGHRLLTDDVAAIDSTDCYPHPLILPSFGRMKLWRDSLERLGAMDAKLPRVRGVIDKFLLSSSQFDPAPVKLSAVYGLTTARGTAGLSILPLSGHLSAAMLLNNVYRSNVAQFIDGNTRLFDGVIKLARNVPTWIIQRPNDLTKLDDLARQVEEHVLAA